MTAAPQLTAQPPAAADAQAADTPTRSRAAETGDALVGTPRRRTCLVFFVTALFTTPAPFATGYAMDGPKPGPWWLPVLLGVVLLGLQMRHSLASARGLVPRFGWWSYAAITTLTFAPLPSYGWTWAMTAYMFAATTLMMLPTRLGLAAVAATVLGYGTAAGLAGYAFDGGIVDTVSLGLLWVFSPLGAAIAVYGVTVLARLADQLHATQAELAEIAVGRERLRVSRDLHDLLGQSLSAISLKGDLALRLLSRDPAAARDQLADITEVARGALGGVRAVARDEHAVSLATETAGAHALLRAAGVTASGDLAAADGAGPATAEVLAWAVREGVTNVLRHSTATVCELTAVRRGGLVVLSIVNDGVRDGGDDPSRRTGTEAGTATEPRTDTTAVATGSRPTGTATAATDAPTASAATARSGRGLQGLAGRAAALGGRAYAGPVGGGRFRVTVELPYAVGPSGPASTAPPPERTSS
ncbi:sensor histidine kinase [Yinghuangia seranimata]|uniref:sensor histidine kinase n=1 Tax=Yinghuangia seranimata TaxID=408067 RepID=UPI00248D1AFE|nr:histidine kinase [Yinghuangia seranimata]MDI2130615.1 histidine kinase [Yinghuangia seranimata]